MSFPVIGYTPCPVTVTSPGPKSYTGMTPNLTCGEPTPIFTQGVPVMARCPHGHTFITTFHPPKADNVHVLFPELQPHDP